MKRRLNCTCSNQNHCSFNKFIYVEYKKIGKKDFGKSFLVSFVGLFSLYNIICILTQNDSAVIVGSLS